jgi:hypothetical protein
MSHANFCNHLPISLLLFGCKYGNNIMEVLGNWNITKGKSGQEQVDFVEKRVFITFR